MFKSIYMHMHENGVYFHQKQRIKKRFLVRNDYNISNSN